MKKILLPLLALSAITYAFYQETKKKSEAALAFAEQELTITKQKLTGKIPLESQETKEKLANWVNFLESQIAKLKA